MRATDPATKARRSEMRRAGHAWGSRIAEMTIAEIATREAALREIGADDADIEAWAGACSKQFIARMRNHFGRLHERGSVER
jgi:hypothetical protein